MRRPLSPAQAVIHTRSRLRSSLKPRRRSVQITMWLHIERGAESGRGRREAQRAPRGRTAGPRAAALKGIDLAGRRAEPSRAEPGRAEPSTAPGGSGRGRLSAAARVEPHRVCAPAASASLPSAASSGGSSLSLGTAPPQSPDSPPPPPLLNPTRPGRLLSSPQPNMAAVAAAGAREPTWE